jgi:hypothetical protein
VIAFVLCAMAEGIAGNASHNKTNIHGMGTNLAIANLEIIVL